MNCSDCIHAIPNGGPCQMDAMQRTSISDNFCHCFLGKSQVIKLPCKVGSTIYMHAYNRTTKKYEVVCVRDIVLSELAVLIQDKEPIFLDEAVAADALKDRNYDL